jgi:gamma-glutamyltranspeptidase/glutathione hydrolase
MASLHKPGRLTVWAMCLGLASALGTLLLASSSPGADDGHTVEARNGVVVSVSQAASEVGVAVLKGGGNAVDAAVATAFALAVTYPAAGNLGGGGYLLVHPGEGGGPPRAFDFRETAPGAATREMFAKAQERAPHRRIGVPGTVRGLALAHQTFGTRSWKTLLAPAVRLAEQGFPLDEANAASLNAVLRSASGDTHAELHRVFGEPSEGEWRPGDKLVQPDLARTLRRIADGGAEAFYTGETADLIVAEMKRFDGLISKEDLTRYRALERDPVHGTYHGYDIYGVPPSSSGGTCTVEVLNILEQFDLKAEGRWSAQALHLLAEAMRRGYCDRARYLGDPDFISIPGHLISKEHAKELAKGIDRKKATRSEDLAKDLSLRGEGEDTTHFSVIDKQGMAVSMTYTLESLYGSGVVVKGAGFLLNDEMNDFNWVPGVTSRDGQIGTDANVIAPGKRMLSSQAPTVVARDDRVVLVAGSPGGRTIINTVVCVLINVLDFNMDVRSAVDAPRLHHQWFPDQLRVEPELVRDHGSALEALRQWGHRMAPPAKQGDAHTIWVDPKSRIFVGAADRRTSGSAAGY